MDKLENNGEYNKDIDYFDLDDELDQEGNPIPEKIKLSEDLINGDKDAKRIVESLYKSLDFVYGIYKPQYVPKWLKCLEISLPIIFLLTSIFLIISTFALKVERSLMPTMLIPALVCIFFSTFTTYLFILKNKMQQVWWYKDLRKTVAIYKPTRKTENGDIVIYVNKNYQYRYYYKEQVWKKNKLQCMDARLLFKHLNGKLRIENYSNGNIEIYTCNPSKDSFRNSEANQISARLVIKDNIAEYIEHIYSTHRQGRSDSSERFEFIEINTDRYVEIPKSFITFCQVEGIEPLVENEHLHYV